MTNNIERIRSLFMAALMVVSVVAVSSALVGTAAAGVASADRSVSDSSVSPGGEVTVTTTVNMDGDGGSVTISESFSPEVQSASIQSVEVDGSSASTLVEAADSTGALVTVQDTPADATVEVTYTVTTEDAENQSYDITGTASGSGTTADIGTTTVETTAAADDDDDNQDDQNDEPTEREGVPLDTGSTYYGGQEVFVQGLTDGNEYRVRELNDDDEPGSLARRLAADDNGIIEFELDGELSDGDFVIVDDEGAPITTDEDGVASTSSLAGDGSVSTSDQFEVVTQDLTAEFEDASVGNDGGSTDVEYEISSDVRTDYDVNVSANGLDVDDLNDIFGDSITTAEYDDDDIVTVAGDTTYDLDFEDISADTYTFEANVTDTGASDSDDIEVTDTGDASADFGENVFADQRGDVVNISVQMSNTDVATLQIGNVDDSGYSVAAEVEDDDEDGMAYVEFNTFTAGNQSLLSTTLTAGDDDTSISNRTAASGSFADNISPTGSEVIDDGDYNLYVQEGEKTSETIDDDDFDSRSTLDLTEPSVNGLQMWTAPEDTYDDLESADVEDLSEFAGNNLTETNTIAQGDTAVVQVDASGLEGAVESGNDATDTYNETSAAGNLFDLVFEGDTVPNSPDQSANIADVGTSNYAVLYDGANDAHYVVVDSSALVDAGDLTYEDGDEYTANFTAYDDDSDLFDDNVSVTQDFSVEDRDIELDTNADDEIVLGAAAGQEVTGTTNVAPGSDIEVSLDSDTSGDPFVKRPEGTVNTDGSFTAVADFSDNDAGSEFTATASIGDFDSDEYDGRLIEGTAPPMTDNGTATPDNGTATPDDGTATPETEEPPETGEEPMTEDDGEATATPTSGSGPGFTAALALVALVAAALLAVRRNN